MKFALAALVALAALFALVDAHVRVANRTLPHIFSLLAALCPPAGFDDYAPVPELR